MKKGIIFVFLLLAGILSIPKPVFAEGINSFVLDAAIQTDGSVNFKEQIQYDFSPNSRHGIFRTIPTTKTNSDGKEFSVALSDYSVLDRQNAPYRYSTTQGGSSVQLKIGDPNVLLEGQKTYVIGYKALGAITYFSDHDELYWNVTGNEWTVPIGYAEAHINFPVKDAKLQVACFTGASGSKQSDCTYSIVNGTAIVKTTKPLAVGEGFTEFLDFRQG